jgi:general secretion pathway protein E
MKIGDVLVKAGKITPAQLSAALEQQSSSVPREQIGRMLIAAGLIQEHDVLQALGEQFHLPVFDRIDDGLIDASLIEKIPVDWARQHLVFPVRDGSDVVAVMADPAALPRMEELALLMGEELAGAIAPAEEIKRAIDQAYFERKREAPVMPAVAPVSGGGVETGATMRSDDLLRAYDSAPVTQLANSIILDAVRGKASDIHIEPYENHLRIRFRIDGFLYEQSAPPKHLEQALISRLKVMSRLDISERRLPQDGMAKVRAGEREIDIRVSTVPVAEGERVVLRLLNQSSTLLPLSELGMPATLLTRFREIIEMPNGIILVTGPTGSGKTTTLYAALREMDTIHRNILTIEDPIEYQIANIGQIQVKPKIGLTFASGLRHILRQDPDVILVGEIRDQETAEIAVRAALTGHLVFSTLHTNDAASAVVRLADMGVQPYLIGSSVRAILAQRLVRRLCPACRRESSVSDPLRSGWGEAWAAALRGKVCYEPVGCDACMQGYRGRIGLYELLTIGTAEQDEIRRGLDHSTLQDLAMKQGVSMMHDAMGKVIDGLTSLDEVRRVLEPPARNAGS